MVKLSKIGVRVLSAQVGREALESSSAVLQTAARPSQLPAHVGLFWGCPIWTRKKARCLSDTEPSCRKQFALSECHVSNLVPKEYSAGILPGWNVLALRLIVAGPIATAEGIPFVYPFESI